MRMPLSCQQTCVLVTLVHGLDFCQPAVEWDGGGVSRAVVRLGTIRKSPNPLSFSTCWTQNLRLLRSWDLSSNKIQFCVNDEKKINYFIPHLWRAENKSWLYSWKSFESAWSDLVEKWRLTDKSNYLFFFFLFLSFLWKVEFSEQWVPQLTRVIFYHLDETPTISERSSLYN